ncbi:MAG: DUF4199 domain-containing protein [Odoribacter sp.]|nr:DUF4199 domain-containing protein [Odoribacter sp.]
MEKQRSVYRRGAEGGLVMGPLMALAVILMGATAYVSWLAWSAIICFLAVPALATFMLSRGFAEDKRRSSFSALWLQGICTFFFGALLMALIVFCALRWIWPGFISDQICVLTEILSQSTDPDAAMWIKSIERMRETGNMPTPIQIALELIYFAVFTGSLLSMLLSMLIRLRRPRVTPPSFKP